MNILKRTTLLVRDAESSAAWYERVFGMKRWLDVPFTLSGTGLAIGNAGDETHLIVMQCEDPHIGMLGLLEFVRPEINEPPVSNELRFGMPIFVFESDDVKSLCARVKSAGGQVFAEPYEWAFAYDDGRTKRMLGCSLFDPDGYFFEVNECVSIDA